MGAGLYLADGIPTGMRNSTVVVWNQDPKEEVPGNLHEYKEKGFNHFTSRDRAPEVFDTILSEK